MSDPLTLVITKAGHDRAKIEEAHGLSHEDCSLLLAIGEGRLTEVWRAGSKGRLNYDRLVRLIDIGLVTARPIQRVGTEIFSDLAIRPADG